MLKRRPSPISKRTKDIVKKKAIPLANTELEMAHLFGLKEAATAQIMVSNKFAHKKNNNYPSKT